MSERYIWIVRWGDFQHYRPERDRPPAWIKDYTRQGDDDRYRDLPLGSRGLLRDLRAEFARSRSELRADPKRLSSRLGATVYRHQLERLNHAGFIELVSRETLERRLEELYSSPRARVEGEGEGDKDHPLPLAERGGSEAKLTCKQCGEPGLEPGRRCKVCGATPRAAGSNLRELAKPKAPSAYERAEAFTRNAGWQLEVPGFLEELERFELDEAETSDLLELRSSLGSMNGNPFLDHESAD